MATEDFVLWLISYTVGNPCGLKSARRLLDHPNRNPTRRLHDITVTPGVVASLHSLSGEPYALRWPIWDRSKWVDSDKHAQLTTDAYDVFVAIVYSNVVI